jgi:hypothetical protein
MSLTRRLYRLDEVRAALLHSLKAKRLYEAVFWLKELEDSCYSGEARRLLLVSWLMNIGILRLSWLHAWSQAGDTREGRLRLCWQLIKCQEQDSSLWLLLWAGALDTSGASSLVSQWRYVSTLEEEDVWGHLFEQTDDERICSILEALQVDMKTYSLYAKCIGYALVYSGSLLPSSTWSPLSEKEPSDLLATIQSWTERITVKDARIYSIPYDCLFAMTWRGTGVDTTDDLRTVNLESFWKSAIWKPLVKGYSVSATEWTSDEALETFWDTEFKGCDIPDEWSKQEQEQSHGRGVTFPDGPLARWWKIWIGPDHRLIWGISKRCVETHIGTISGNFGGASVLDKLLQLYKEPRTVEPVKKREKEYIFAD